MAAPFALRNTFPVPPAPVSSKTFTIAGILTTVYGLDELQSSHSEVACLWLLHERLATKSCMDPVAAAIIGDWNQRLREGEAGQTPKGLVAVSFDQRNHGSREVDSLANGSWRDGNATHAVDMFSIYHGTAMDTSLLQTYLSSYIFPRNEHLTATNLLLGVSLGGHAAWQCLVHNPKFTAAVIVIGCPDYGRLMTDRAAKSKLQTWTINSPPDANFLGSKNFPQGLMDAVSKLDPEGLLTAELDAHDDSIALPTEAEAARLMPLMKSRLGGKRILNLAGGADKLVPYKCSEPFITWLQSATKKGGWFSDGNCVVENMVFDGVGHEMSPEMVTEATRFISETLVYSSPGRDSKM